MNNEKMNEMIEILNESINMNGLSATLGYVFGNGIKVSIPMTASTCETPIENITIGNRAENALKRMKLFTIGELTDYLNTEDIMQARNIGKKTVSEIKTKLLVYLFDQLNSSDRKAFLSRLLNDNCDFRRG